MKKLALALLVLAVLPGCRLYTQGNRIVNQDGDTVVLHGVNSMQSEWSGSMGLEAQSLPLMSSQWGGHIVIRGFASTPVNQRSGPYLAMLDEYVQLGLDHKFYVAFVYRSAGIDGAQPNMPDSAATAALTYLAQRYKDKVNVIFGLQVEPHNVTWTQVRPLWEQMIDSIRGPNGSGDSQQPLILAPGVRWGHDVSGAVGDPVRRPNVAYKVHPYGPKSYWQTDFIGPHNQGLPIFIGEFSYAPDLESTMTEVNDLLAYAKANQISWAAWIWDTCNCGAGQEDLISSWSTAAPTSPYGVAVKNAMP